MNRFKINRAAMSAAACVGFGVVGSVAAQQTTGEGGDPFLEEILVTAQRRSQGLQEVPLSVTALSSDALQKAQVRDLLDYAALTPNFKAVNYGTPGESDVSIRGVSNIGGQSSSIAVYNDEFGVDRFDFDLDDVERIEVLRGPQGTLFGRNTIAGAVNIIYNKPKDEFESSAYVEGGSYSTYRANVMVNAPVNDSGLAVRANLGYGSSDGYLRDVGPGGNSDDYERYSGRIALRQEWDRLTLDLSFAMSDMEQGIQSSVSTGLVSGPVAGVGIPTGIDSGAGFFPDNTRRIATNTPTESGYRYDMTILRAEYNFDAVKLVLIAGNQDVRIREVGELDRTAGNYVNLNYKSEATTRSIETRLESATDSSVGFLFGASYGESEEDQRLLTVFTPEFFSLLGFPPSLAPFNIDDRTTAYEKRSYALFGQASWTSPNKTWVLEVGARYTNDEYDMYNLDNAQSFATFQPYGNVFNETADEDDITPKASVTYRINDDVHLYGVVSRGYKSGGFNTAASRLTQTPVDYGKETATSYEIGLKSEFFERRMRFNAAAFKLDWRDIQVEQYFLDETLAVYVLTQNAASATVQGVEFEVTALPMAGLELQASLGYNDNSFDEFRNAINSAGEEVDASGNRLPFTSEWQAAFSGEYSFPVGGGDLFLRGEYSWASDFFQSSDNREEVGYYIDALDTINARIGWRSDRLQITAFAENIGGEDDARLWNLGNYLSGYQAVIRPERFGVRVGVSF
jgi:iron complex outermembrane receptor protein